MVGQARHGKARSGLDGCGAAVQAWLGGVRRSRDGHGVAGVAEES